MAVEIGTADNYLDLLDKLRIFLTTNEELVNTGQQWEILRWNNGHELILKAPGLSGAEKIYMGIWAYENTTNDYYNFNICGLVGYIPEHSFADQPYKQSAFVCLWQHKIPYWFIANGQRVIVAAKISTVYEYFYLGKILPYGTPQQYPYPLFVGGTTNADGERWSGTGARHSGFQCPGYGSYLYTIDSVWRRVCNREPYSSSHRWRGENTIFLYPTDTWSFGGGNCKLSNIQQNTDSTYTLLPYILHTSDQPAKNVYGELDGAYWITGNKSASENIITINGQDYLVIQNIHRTTWADYLALELK
ncbi:hypothetical protein [Spartinivicinus ruber]|uniref:hypothetical protein n=1 Tax=Spartinivicinus ruber TaxID=2683272 RepID=UPI0013D1B5A2|nr:hypothetical protein [Spartinivicinus ruber]